MTNLVAFTGFILFALAALGLFFSGVGAIRQARLAKRMFKLRYGKGQGRESDESEAQ